MIQITETQCYYTADKQQRTTETISSVDAPETHQHNTKTK